MSERISTSLEDKYSLSSSDTTLSLPHHPVVRPSAAALGNAAFALTSFISFFLNTGLLFEEDVKRVVLPFALVCGGLTQYITAWFEFSHGDTFSGTAFGGFGCYWLSHFVFIQFMQNGLSTTSVGHATGLFGITWAIFTFYMTIASFKVSLPLFILFMSLFFASITNAIAAFTSSVVVSQAAGFIGLIAAFIGFYLSAVDNINYTWKRKVISANCCCSGFQKNDD